MTQGFSLLAMKDASLSHVGRSILIALALLVAANAALYTLLYADTFTPLALPYSENFDADRRITYRQFGGAWRVRDGTLVQTDDSGTDLMNVLPLPMQPGQPYSFSTRLLFLRGRNGGGLMFNLQQRDNRRGSHLVRFGTGDNGQYLVFGYFDEALEFVGQGATTYPQPLGEALLAVRVHASTYDVLVNDEIVKADVPLRFQGGYPALTSWFSVVAFDDVTLAVLDEQPAAAPPEAAPDALPAYFADTFDADSLSTRWLPLSEGWSIQDGALMQTDAAGFDLSVRSAAVYDRYSFSAQLRHSGQPGGGVLFNVPADSTRAGAHMARFFDDNSLVWGYFDADGVFQGQGYRALGTLGDSLQTLEVRVDGSAYNLFLNGEQVASGVPLYTPRGSIGLTTTQSVVTFEAVEVRAPETASALASAVVTTDPGDWSGADGILTQTMTDPAEFHRAVGMYGEVFQVSVNVALPDRRSPAQGGLIFHAPDPAQMIGAHWVRFADNGAQIRWGTVDLDGQFVQQGSAALDTAAGPSHLLALAVDQTSFDILVDGKPIAQALPLQSPGGWLRFSSLGGPVTFSNFRLTLTQVGG